LAASPIHQVLVERYLEGWKEIEYEVMRDSADNCITVCNMENLDPMGVHTGDSIVVAPSQTLSDKEYQMLRSASLKIIRALGIEGGCNIQFALAPGPLVAEAFGQKMNGPSDYYVIEVNPRVSRSSALASKATGYPIARVATKIAVGRTLDQIPNAVTGKTMAAFEPALDYCVVKIPRWPFDKFASGDRSIGTQMKSTGEVMAIDRCFEAALQKAVRSLEVGRRPLLWEDKSWSEADGDGPDALPLEPNDLRIWALMAALRKGFSPEDLSRRTGIDPWFTTKLGNIVAMQRRLLKEPLTPQFLRQAKRMGFSDEEIGTLADRLPEQVRNLRHQWGLRPVYKMVDTCAAEFEAVTPYFYSSYEQENETKAMSGPRALVIGSGPIRIGQGIEFDYCSVHAAWALQKEGITSIMVNSNPETVSTDFDISDRLYFEPLDEESIRDILDNENGLDSGADTAPAAIVVQFGGQTAINLAEPLYRSGASILGSSSDTIDIAEDRQRFEDFLNRLGIPQPPGASITTIEEGLNVAQNIGYPVLVRPSYVLGGRAMEIVHNATELIRYITGAVEVGRGRSILVDKYLEGMEVEADAICDGEQVLIPGIMEHIERAGVHSGDSMAVYPAPSLTQSQTDAIVDYTVRIGLGLQVKGLMNIQYVVMNPGKGRDGEVTEDDGEPLVYVLEVNPRASRTVPFLSKVTTIPMVQIATRVMMGTTLKAQGYRTGLRASGNLVAIKAPVFSMAKLVGVDTYLGPEMKSTGEVMGIDHKFGPALAKALLAGDMMLPTEGAILLSIADRDKAEALSIVRKLDSLHYRLFATEGTAEMVRAVGLPVTPVAKFQQGDPDIVDLIRDGKVIAVINTLTGHRTPLRDGFQIRRAAAEQRIPCFTSLDTARAVVDSLLDGPLNYNVKPLKDYLNPPI
ncbi:MAG: carbamoyl-phosphate synthase large subunit, partial [Chloroflexi bacterium]|nr:carbamoyl-phosphate synthase large subunit [Chloroflexota bacterium]